MGLVLKFLKLYVIETSVSISVIGLILYVTNLNLKPLVFSQLEQREFTKSYMSDRIQPHVSVLWSDKLNLKCV